MRSSCRPPLFYLSETSQVCFIQVYKSRFPGTLPLKILTGTKYFGGHSDLLAGVLVVKTIEDWNKACSSNLNTHYNQCSPIPAASRRPHILGQYDGFAGVMVAPSLLENASS